MIIIFCAVDYLIAIPIAYYIMRRWGKSLYNTSEWGKPIRPIAWAIFFPIAIMFEIVFLLAVGGEAAFRPLIRLIGKMFDKIDNAVKRRTHEN